jgi:hypothetical protein
MKTFEDFLTCINSAILEYQRQFSGKKPQYLVLGKEELEFMQQDSIMEKFSQEPSNITDEGNVEYIWSMRVCRSPQDSMLIAIGELA